MRSFRAKWKININEEKTKIMMIRKNKTNKKILNIKIDKDSRLDQVTETRYHCNTDLKNPDERWSVEVINI